MSERKVINKYFPPDFDPSKIKRRKMGKDPQQVVRLMAPFSMRCNKCGEYIYKGKKFNARKETATGEEYYGIKIFRFYIKCTLCSTEITFKTDPKNADYNMEHGATRNFENWSDADPSGRRTGAMPDAAADEDYDSEGNVREEKLERDAMADLERSQAQSRREMDMMDELADLRQRNARLELSNANGDPESLLAALHAERESAEEELRRKAEQDEDDAQVAKHFAKIPTTTGANGDAKGKDKEKAHTAAGNEDASEKESESKEETALPALTIRRKPASGTGANEPSVASLLASKGRSLSSGTVANGVSGARGLKRKRAGVQALMGIKPKTKP